jgi:hypothetical protein
MRASRFSYEVFNGEIPEGIEVCHSCDNPRCVRPGHLHLGTHAQNMAESVLRMRSPKGERNGVSKLTESEVNEIRTMYSSGDYLQDELSKMFGVTRPNISKVVRGQRWKTVASCGTQLAA